MTAPAAGVPVVGRGENITGVSKNRVRTHKI
jgi:hypothetical protein